MKQIKRKLGLAIVISTSLLLQSCLEMVVQQSTMLVIDEWARSFEDEHFVIDKSLEGKTVVYIQLNVEGDNYRMNDGAALTICNKFTKKHPTYSCLQVASSEEKFTTPTHNYGVPVAGEKALYIYVEKIEFVFLVGTSYNIVTKQMDSGKTTTFKTHDFVSTDLNDFVNEYLERLAQEAKNKTTEKTKNEN